MRNSFQHLGLRHLLQVQPTVGTRRLVLFAQQDVSAETSISRSQRSCAKPSGPIVQGWTWKNNAIEELELTCVAKMDSGCRPPRTRHGLMLPKRRPRTRIVSATTSHHRRCDRLPDWGAQVEFGNACLRAEKSSSPSTPAAGCDEARDRRRHWKAALEDSRLSWAS